MSDLREAYDAYLLRVKRHFGEITAGEYGKYQGRLIKTLDETEFQSKWLNFRKILDSYQKMMEREDTINDSIMQTLKEVAAELLIDDASIFD